MSVTILAMAAAPARERIKNVQSLDVIASSELDAEGSCKPLLLAICRLGRAAWRNPQTHIGTPEGFSGHRMPNPRLRRKVENLLFLPVVREIFLEGLEIDSLEGFPCGGQRVLAFA